MKKEGPEPLIFGVSSGSTPTVSGDVRHPVGSCPLLANRYRGKKPPAMQAREADAWREMLEKGEVTKDDLVELARDAEQTRGTASRSEQTQKEYNAPAALSARSAGMIPSMYRSTTYVLDPAKGEVDIRESDLPAPTRSTLVRQIREDRAKLEADRMTKNAEYKLRISSI